MANGADRHRGAGTYRPVIAAALSAVLPGAGQWYAGERRRGIGFLAVAVAAGAPIIALVVLVLYVESDLALTLSRPFFEHPWLLLVLLAVNGIVLVFRVTAVVDAFLLPVRAAPVRRRTGRVSLAAVGGVVLILLAVALPHGWMAERNLALHDLFTHDFISDPGQVTTTTVPVTTTTAPVTTVTASPPTTTSSTTSTSTTTTTTTVPDPFEGYGRVNVLLLGGDAGVGRRGIRTDSMIVVSIDPTTGWTAFFSVTRNTVRIPMPPDIPAYDAYGCNCYPGLANEIYQYGLANPDGFPGGTNTGGNAIKAVLGHLLGLEIHHFALVDLQGFVDVVDAVGGVTITVTERVYDPKYPHEDGTTEVIVIVRGTYDMDGHLALAYARSRRTSDDYDRMGRQRCVIEALAEQAEPIGLLRQLPELVPAIEGSVITDIPVASIPDFLDLLSRADLGAIPSIRFMWRAPEFAGTSTSYVAGWTSDRYPIPNVDLIRQTVETAISLPPEDAIETLNLQPIEDTCG